MASSLEQPTIYVIGGPNGVGKTTFANEFLPHYVRCNEFLNADLIAAGLSPYMPESQNVRASQLMLERMQDLVSKRKTFAFETTLAARSYRQMILEWKELGYRIHLFFLWLPNPDMAVLRVANANERVHRSWRSFCCRGLHCYESSSHRKASFEQRSACNRRRSAVIGGRIWLASCKCSTKAGSNRYRYDVICIHRNPRHQPSSLPTIRSKPDSKSRWICVIPARFPPLARFGERVGGRALTW